MRETRRRSQYPGRAGFRVPTKILHCNNPLHLRLQPDGFIFLGVPPTWPRGVASPVFFCGVSQLRLLVKRLLTGLGRGLRILAMFHYRHEAKVATNSSGTRTEMLCVSS